MDTQTPKKARQTRSTWSDSLLLKRRNNSWHFLYDEQVAYHIVSVPETRLLGMSRDKGTPHGSATGEACMIQPHERSRTIYDGGVARQ